MLSLLDQKLHEGRDPCLPCSLLYPCGRWRAPPFLAFSLSPSHATSKDAVSQPVSKAQGILVTHPHSCSPSSASFACATGSIGQPGLSWGHLLLSCLSPGISEHLEGPLIWASSSWEALVWAVSRKEGPHLTWGNHALPQLITKWRFGFSLTYLFIYFGLSFIFILTALRTLWEEGRVKGRFGYSWVLWSKSTY